ncbi:Mitochondrial translocator assembly and maintenance protein 41, partial [Ascosphaera acerosa]
HRAHYSALGSLGSYAVSRVQDGLGAGVYFNPYVSVNGLLIKYGVVNIDTLCADLSSWATLYLAGRLHKPVKILRDHPRVRLANQRNLLAALRVALLLLPERFSERQLFTTIAGISYLGDPRMNARLGGENPDKVRSIVAGQMAYFRRLYAPLIDTLPNLAYDDPRTASTRPEASWIHDPTLDARLAQDMDPVKRGNMVRRLPSAFREKLYFQYQSRLAIPRGEFNRMMEAAAIDQAQGGGHRRDGGEFEQRIAMDDGGVLRREVGDAIKRTVAWPSTSQSIKSFFTAGVGKSARYMREKRDKYRKAQAKQREATATKPKDE